MATEETNAAPTLAPFDLPLITPRAIEPVKAAPPLTHIMLAPGVPGGVLPVSKFTLKEHRVYAKSGLPDSVVAGLIANGTCIEVPAPDAA